MDGCMESIVRVAVYVAQLFFAWAVVPVLCLMLALPVLSRLGIIANRRGLMTFVIPVISTFQRAFELLSKVFLPLIAISVVFAWKVGAPPPDSRERAVAHMIFG